MTSAIPGQQAALSAAFSRAVDLSALKSRASAPPTALGAAAPARSPFVLDVTEEIFGAIVEKSHDVLVIIDLWATWCEPCKQLSPALERVVDSFHGSVLLAKVDVDANPRIAQAFQVQSVPTIVALAQGNPVDAFSGAQPEPQLRTWMTSLVDALRDKLPGIAAAEAGSEDSMDQPEPAQDPRHAAAQDAIEMGDYPAALAAYQAILDAEPANTEVLAALGQVRFLQRVESLTPEVVAEADSDPDNLVVQIAAADYALFLGEAEQAFDRLIAVVARNGEPDRARAREHLVELFALVGTEDALVVKARRKLAAALY
ncbi:co-chaperone YbbN [Nakamurella antarctica]|uniref:Co-chaperone YbbN n=1 Tax=Nakamurella antarctica TaxID=1902245 RepID=A0A3G8ZV07_9ACTN|nr:tetratricopeptide repeat protein [Nakamurella antarctica]AZI57846.1 co-chaperone YbbN [Nakamurella antarctica]